MNVVRKSYRELSNLTTCQELRSHTLENDVLVMNRKAIWIMKFSIDRRYFATAGEDGIINIWKVKTDPSSKWDGHVFEEEPIHSFKGHTV